MHESIEWLYGLQHFGIKLGLDNIRALLRELGQPQTGYRCLHVAGTNGKGSVAAMVDAMLAAAGVRAGLYTSPHLVHPRERIRVAGRDIAPGELHERLLAMRARIEAARAAGRLETHPSFFEVVTATALACFRDHGLRAAVLEVGLGGRLDATNAVDADVGAVVSIALDHTKSLGSTVARIAEEKAGIVKPGMPIVSGIVQQRARDVLRRVCRERGARLVDARLAARLVAEDAEGLTLVTPRGRYAGLRLAIAGRHQIDNARVALVAFELLAERIGVEPRVEAVREGLARVRWPGRLQWLDPRDGGPELLLDGAHNPAGTRALAAHVAALERPRPVLLFGATSGKPFAELLEPLVALAEAVVLTRPPVDRGVDPATLLPAVGRPNGAIEVVEQPRAALARARSLAGSGRYVLITGSLYLVGEVLALLSRDEVPGPVAM